MKATFNPGFVDGGGTVPTNRPSPNRAALGGLRNKRRCASNVIGFVGCILTSAVEFRYGTNMVLDPSLPLSPELRRNNRRPCASFCDRL